MIMQEDQTIESERRETLDELSDLFTVVQQMGQRLATETHGDRFAPVQALNELLHGIRAQISECQAIDLTLNSDVDSWRYRVGDSQQDNCR
jgi:hypothetical protein